MLCYVEKPLMDRRCADGGVWIRGRSSGGDPPFEDGTQSVEATFVQNFMAPALGNQPDQQKAMKLASGYFRPWALGDGQ